MQPYQMQTGYNVPYSNYSQFGGYNPMSYQERINQGMQQFQQQQQQQFQSQQVGIVSGKIVESIDVVKSMDIPMDGNMYYFPKADGSEIFVKCWLPNATTQIITFKPIIESEQNSKKMSEENIDLSEKIAEIFDAKMDEIRDRFDKLEKSIKPVKNRKEVNADE